MNEKRNKILSAIITGLIWGVIMFLIMEIIIMPLMGYEISAKTFYLGLPIWLFGGVIFGFLNLFINKIMIKKKK